MSEADAYLRAYQRERQARLLAEKLLDEKTRVLYDKVLELNETLGNLQHTRNQLLQTEKLAAMGQLTSGLAHEINNPIGFCISNVKCLREWSAQLIALAQHAEALDNTPTAAQLSNLRTTLEQLDLPYLQEELPILLDETEHGLSRVRDLISKLQQYTELGQQQEQSISLHSSIAMALATLGEHKQQCHIEKILGSDIVVIGNELEVQLILSHLLNNAVDACHGKGLIRLVLRSHTEQDREWAIIEVIDSGCGIAAENLQRIFDPFFSTKDVGHGTGLGLSMSYSIAIKHGGSLSVQSQLGQGSCFSLQLPLAPVV
ncbi:sensor histidine kinase [Undibacterium crateris]|uniref:sensor histidine kinase n=1 Tax=Undibacterium crateris TaxID=2528175 RepID=UPI00138A3515|nr:ATP-binding protein [Undibacterium crateris]NDI84470.1 histidine kinase [Undibacterium crateris]